MGRLPQRVRLAKASRGTGKWFVRKGDSCDYEGSELRALFLGIIVGLDGIVSGALLDTDDAQETDGGKNVVHQRDSVWNGQPYKMQHMVSGVLKQKGLKTILQERGDWDHDMAKEAAVARLALHIDFQQQREWLAETVENAGHKIDYYPKFHCELNFIEMVWGYCKTKLRRRCTYNFKDMQTELPHTLRTVPIPFFRRVYRHCMRYMSGYRRGLEGPLLDYALKKYKSHRAIPVFVLAELEVELQADKEKKKVKRELA